MVDTLMGAGGNNPLCRINIWKTQEIPAMFYGRELWNNMRSIENDMFNSALCICRQTTSKTTGTEGTLSTIGPWITAGQIDKIKLLLFENLCCSSPDFLRERIFVRRLFAILLHETDLSIEFVPDIEEYLRKYSLYSYLEYYLVTGYFPSKSIGRKLVVERIWKNEEEYWKGGLALKQELIHLQRTSFSLDLIFHWEAAKKHPF